MMKENLKHRNKIELKAIGLSLKRSKTFKWGAGGS